MGEHISPDKFSQPELFGKKFHPCLILPCIPKRSKSLSSAICLGITTYGLLYCLRKTLKTLSYCINVPFTLQMQAMTFSKLYRSNRFFRTDFPRMIVQSIEYSSFKFSEPFFARFAILTMASYTTPICPSKGSSNSKCICV